MSLSVFAPHKYNPGQGNPYAIATRLLNPKEARPKKRPGVWFVWRFRSVFVHQSLLASSVVGQSFGLDLDLMRLDVEQAIHAHGGKAYDMTVALSQRSVLRLIEKQLKAAKAKPTVTPATSTAPSTP